jgi:hypothetical protein
MDAIQARVFPAHGDNRVPAFTQFQLHFAMRELLSRVTKPASEFAIFWVSKRVVFFFGCVHKASHPLSPAVASSERNSERVIGRLETSNPPNPLRYA